jgi:hypothetical protein
MALCRASRSLTGLLTLPLRRATSFLSVLPVYQRAYFLSGKPIYGCINMHCASTPSCASRQLRCCVQCSALCTSKVAGALVNLHKYMHIYIHIYTPTRIYIHTYMRTYILYVNGIPVVCLCKKTLILSKLERIRYPADAIQISILSRCQNLQLGTRSRPAGGVSAVKRPVDMGLCFGHGCSTLHVLVCGTLPCMCAENRLYCSASRKPS